MWYLQKKQASSQRDFKEIDLQQSCLWAQIYEAK